MTASFWIARPRWLAGLTLAFALVPVGLAVVTYRDARTKEALLFDASAQVLGSQLQRSLERHDYFLGVLRDRALRLEAPALLEGRFAPLGFDWQQKLPHLAAFGFATADASAEPPRLRWKSPGERAPTVALRQPLAPGESYLPERRQLQTLFTVPGPDPAPAVRGSVTGWIVGWIDLGSLCADPSLPLLRDHVLSAVPLVALASLAGRVTRLRVALAAEQEVTSQQRFFTQSVSHEFRTPLGIILSGTDLLDRYAEHLTPERRREVLAEIRASTHSMTEMVDGVLLLGRIESGKLACSPQPLNLAGLCREMARKVAAAQGARAAITLDAADETAPLDAALLGSVLENLLSNAVKYSPPGEPVSLGAVREKGRVIFTVRDGGRGIPAEDLARVCDPFHRGGNVGEAPGSGLGLAIARRCTELHGGTLAVESALGRGTTVTVIIPTP